MTTATATTPVTRGDVEYLLAEHRKLTHFGQGWGKLGPRDDWHTARRRLASHESIAVIERVRDWLLTAVEPRRSRFGAPTDVEVTTAAARALGVAVSPGECLAACLLAGVDVDFFADAGVVTIAVTHDSVGGAMTVVCDRCGAYITRDNRWWPGYCLEKFRDLHRRERQQAKTMDGDSR